MDAGLKYLKMIDFQRIKGKWGLLERWKKDFGIKEGVRLWEEYMNMLDNNTAGTLEFYKFKSSHPLISKGLVEWYDGDIIRKACNYIDSHKDYFGKTILDVGCDIGYMTGFIAMTFPESRIVAIDRCEEAINIARERFSSLGITNVEFRVSDVNQIDEQFDTVFAMRTLHENEDREMEPFCGDPIDEQIIDYASVGEDYIKKLKSCTKDKGNLCIIQEINNELFILGLSYLFLANHIQYIDESYEKLVCSDGEFTLELHAFICTNEGTITPDSFMGKYAAWRNKHEPVEEKNHILHGMEALIYLKENAGEMIRGYYVIDPDDNIVGRFIAFKDKDDDGLMYYLTATLEETVLQGVNTDTGLDSVITHMENSASYNLHRGCKIEAIDPEDDYIEGTDGIIVYKDN